MTNKKSNGTKERAVLVTTKHRGIFFGYATDVDGEAIWLHRARNCLAYTADSKGFLGLASIGPTSGARVGPAADKVQLRDITCVAECTPNAVEAWEKFPWRR